MGEPAFDIPEDAFEGNDVDTYDTETQKEEANLETKLENAGSDEMAERKAINDSNKARLTTISKLLTEIFNKMKSSDPADTLDAQDFEDFQEMVKGLDANSDPADINNSIDQKPKASKFKKILKGSVDLAKRGAAKFSKLFKSNKSGLSADFEQLRSDMKDFKYDTTFDEKKFNDLKDRLDSFAERFEKAAKTGDLKKAFEFDKKKTSKIDQLKSAIKLLIMIGGLVGAGFLFKKYWDGPHCRHYKGGSWTNIDVDSTNCNCTIPHTDCTTQDDLERFCGKNAGDKATCGDYKGKYQTAICVGQEFCKGPWTPSDSTSVTYTYVEPSLVGAWQDLYNGAVVEPAQETGNALINFLKQFEKPLIYAFGAIVAIYVLKILVSFMRSRKQVAVKITK